MALSAQSHQIDRYFQYIPRADASSNALLAATSGRDVEPSQLRMASSHSRHGMQCALSGTVPTGTIRDSVFEH